MRRALLVILAILTACSDQEVAPPVDEQPSNAEAAATGSKACELLTSEVAARALGRPVKKLASDGGPAGLDICQYGYEGERLSDTGNVSVTVQPLDLASLKAGAQAQGYKLEPITGVGDAAYYSTDIGLYVGKGQRTAIYLLGAGGMTDAKERSIALAKASIDRL